MKKIVCAVSVRLAVANERLLLWKNKQLVLQEQHINHFGLQLLSTACEVVQDAGKWVDMDCEFNLPNGFMIQFDIRYMKYAIKIALSTINGFGMWYDDEVIDQLLKPNIPRNKGLNNS